MSERAKLVLAAGAVGAGFVVLRDLRTDPQVKLARDLLQEVRQSIREETDEEVSDEEANFHIDRWESVSRSYYALLSREQKESVVATPDEFAERADKADTVQEEALLWKGYAVGVLQSFLVQEGRPGFDSDDFASFLWRIIKYGLLVAGIVSMLPWIARKTLDWFKSRAADPDGTKQSSRDKLSQSIGAWITEDVLDNPESQMQPYFDVLILAEELEIGIDEIFTDPAGDTVTSTATWGEILDFLNKEVRELVEDIIDIAEDAIIEIEAAAADIMAAISDKDRQWWLNLGAAALTAATVIALIAGGAILAPEPTTTAAGTAVLFALGAFIGVSFSHSDVARRSVDLRKHVRGPV